MGITSITASRKQVKQYLQNEMWSLSGLSEVSRQQIIDDFLSEMQKILCCDEINISALPEELRGL